MNEGITTTEAITLTAQLVALYPVPEWTDARVQLFAATLVDEGITFAEAQSAVREYRRTEERQPVPASILKLVRAARKKINPYIGTPYEHFRVLWDCPTCGDCHEGDYHVRPVCTGPKKITEEQEEQAGRRGAAILRKSRARVE